MTEGEMVGWHHQLCGREFERPPGVGDGQGSLMCCSLRGHKESDMTERLNSNKYLLVSQSRNVLTSLLGGHLVVSLFC